MQIAEVTHAYYAYYTILHSGKKDRRCRQSKANVCFVNTEKPVPLYYRQSYTPHYQHFPTSFHQLIHTYTQPDDDNSSTLPSSI